MCDRTADMAGALSQELRNAVLGPHDWCGTSKFSPSYAKLCQRSTFIPCFPNVPSELPAGTNALIAHNLTAILHCVQIERAVALHVAVLALELDVCICCDHW